MNQLFDLHKKVQDALRDRLTWENKQAVFYAMRNGGLRRMRPPFPGAADQHDPIVDGAIEKTKPFFFNQLFTGKKLADFTCSDDSIQSFTDSAADYFDWKLKECSNLIRSIISTSDTMLVRGIGIIKVTWDDDAGEVNFEAVDPLFFIVPSGGEGPDVDDWFCHVKKMSVAKYRNAGCYDISEDTIQKVRGGPINSEQSEQEKQWREGVNFTEDKETVLLWELWEKTRDGWVIHEYCPRVPNLNIRSPRKSPFKFKGKPFQPFVGFVFEIKDRGWYSSRGLGERLGPFETAACKWWNAKCDAMSFWTVPMFLQTGEGVPNVGNVSFRPGEVLPRGLQPAQMPPIPMSLDEEMSQIKMRSEQYIALPEAGLVSDPTQGARQGGKATATQVNYHAQVQSTVTDMRGIIFRLALSDVYWRAWAILCDRDKDGIAEYCGTQANLLPIEAMLNRTRVKPCGLVEDWNRQNTLTKAAQRFQALNNDPLIDQSELRKDFLNADDGRLVERLLVQNGQSQQDEAEDEAVEIGVLMNGFPVQAKPKEDHLTRIKVIFGKIQQLDALGHPFDPLTLKMLQDHLMQHVQLLAQQNPQAAKQVMQQISGLTRSNSQTAGQQQVATEKQPQNT